ncbi:MAG: hypothetical protein ACKVWV_15285 [Planctomycetota bacterium]
MALIATLMLAGMAGAMLAVGSASKEEHLAAADHMKALYVAEAGLSEGIAAVTNGVVPALGDAANPVAFSSGSYWGTLDVVDDITTVTVFGTSAGLSRGVEAVIEQTSDGIYSSALFAGNSSGDPTYSMKFGGTGTQADKVVGNVYSGGSVAIAGDSAITGTVRASGTISGGTGETGITQPIPDLVGMNYAVNNDIDVKAAFASAPQVTNSTYGGKAGQLPESNPAHIFRKNPNDRTAQTSTTTKDDYFLEDVYEPLSSSSAINAAAGSHITISGLGGEPGANGNGLVYFIDGNLWIHNNKAFSFTLWNAQDQPIKVTFVVKGNIYISDNIFYDNPTKDGLALIAMKDSSVANSGNIYFGDPSFGTLEYMQAFMYAENNFYDNNLSASGSAKVTVVGNMTAGNQVKINRDYGSQHSKLTVNFDSRIWDGALTLPGLPSQSGADPTWVVQSWREVSVP